MCPVNSNVKNFEFLFFAREKFLWTTNENGETTKKFRTRDKKSEMNERKKHREANRGEAAARLFHLEDRTAQRWLENQKKTDTESRCRRKLGRVFEHSETAAIKRRREEKSKGGPAGFSKVALADCRKTIMVSGGRGGNPDFWQTGMSTIASAPH